MKLKKRFNITLVIVLCFTMLFVSSASAVTSVDDYNNQKEDLQLDEEKLEKELDKTKEEIEKEEATLNKYQKEMDELEEEIDKLNIEITSLNNNIEATQKDIESLQKEIDNDYDVLGNRLRSIYMAGETQYLSILLDCEDMATLVDTAAVIQSISEHDNELIAQLNDKLDVMENEKQSLMNEKNTVEESKQELEETSNELDVLYKKTNDILKELEIDLEETEEDMEEITKEKEKLSEELLEYQKQYAQENSYNGSSGSSSAVPTGGSGRYIWPAPECPIITSYWGDGRNHKGWDFACNGSAYGKPIVAAADGVIIQANKTDEWGSGWGYYILIDHGDGYSTLYAHCSYVAVSVGQHVEQGELIGYIGNTGNSYGAHLHFECWKNGVQYDPAIELG